MSSAPGEGKPAKTRKPFEPWRKVMLVGAFILLGHALYVALVDPSIPDWVTTFFNFMGYGFLVAGFGMKMRPPKSDEPGEPPSPGRSGRSDGSGTEGAGTEGL